MIKKTIAVITGASGGLGKEFVRILSDKRELDEIWAIARNESKLNELKTLYGNKVIVFSHDLSDKNFVCEFESKIKDANAEIKYLINNAGFAKFCSYNDISVAESLNMIDLNVSAAVAMGLICIPYIKRNGHIINIASQSAFQPLPYLNIYSATKAFLRNYTRALNVELKDRGITATAVCPGWMNTGLLDRGAIGASHTVTNFAGMASTAAVAQKAIKDADKGKDMSVYGAYTKFCHLVAKLLPQKIMIKLWMHQQHFYNSLS